MFRYKYTFFFALILGLNLNAQNSEEDSIHSVLNNWHRAAATADEKTFFGSMTEACIYLGTDPSERWIRDSLRTWSEKYFQRNSAWSFEPYNRNIVLSENGEYAWFDEMLRTWMGTCRGSGVMHFVDGKWKIEYYHLAVTVKNEIIQDFIDLVSKDSEGAEMSPASERD